MSTGTFELYRRAQLALVELKDAVRELLAGASAEGLTNAEIGRTLGIYAGHEGHQGHISKTILAMLESEGVIGRDAASKRWSLRKVSTGGQLCSDFVVWPAFTGIAKRSPGARFASILPPS